MRDLFDPQNPYRDRYEEWDYWCYLNSRAVESEELKAYYSEKRNPDLLLIRIGVDREGNMVPYRLYYTSGQERLFGNSQQQEVVSCAATMYCIGEIDERLKQEFRAMYCGIRAAYVLPVPEWLAAAPPQAAKYLPDGCFALYGTADAAATDSVWQLYSAEGNLLKRGEPGGSWWHLYFDDFQQVLGIEGKPNLQCWEQNGTITIYDLESNKYLGQYLYDGTPLEAESRDGSRAEAAVRFDPRMFATLSGEEIPLIYAAQLEVTPREPAPSGGP